MIYTKEKLEELNRITRLKIINSVTGIKPANLIGTMLVIGEIEYLIIPETAFTDDDIDLEQTNGVGISGLNSYYELKKIASYPYVRVAEVPKF